MDILNEIDLIQESSLDSFFDVFYAMDDYYSKHNMIQENYSDDDLDKFDYVVQEGAIGDEMKKMKGKNESKAVSILAALPRFIAALIKVITGNTSKSKPIDKDKTAKAVNEILNAKDAKAAVKATEKKMKSSNKGKAVIAGLSLLAGGTGVAIYVKKKKKKDNKPDNTDPKKKPDDTTSKNPEQPEPAQNGNDPTIQVKVDENGKITAPVPDYDALDKANKEIEKLNKELEKVKGQLETARNSATGVLLKQKTQKVADLTKELNATKKELDDTKEQLKDAQETMDRGVADTKAAANIDIQRLNKQLADTEAKASAKIKELNSIIKTKDQEIGDLKKTLDESAQLLENLKTFATCLTEIAKKDDGDSIQGNNLTNLSKMVQDLATNVYSVYVDTSAIHEGITLFSEIPLSSLLENLYDSDEADKTSETKTESSESEEHDEDPGETKEEKSSDEDSDETKDEKSSTGKPAIKNHKKGDALTASEVIELISSVNNGKTKGFSTKKDILLKGNSKLINTAKVVQLFGGTQLNGSNGQPISGVRPIKTGDTVKYVLEYAVDDEDDEVIDPVVSSWYNK